VRKIILSGAILAVLSAHFAPNARAEYKFPTGLQFGINASATSGIGGFVGFANKNADGFWAKRFGIRFDFATMSPVSSAIDSALDNAAGDHLEISDGFMIKDIKLKGKHIGAFVDFYPFGNVYVAGGWRVTGGYARGTLSASAPVTGENLSGSPLRFSLNDQDYRYTGGDVTASAGMAWTYRGPYLGTGFDIGIYRGFKLFLDAGVVFSSKAAQVNIDVPINALLQYQDPVSGTWKDVDATTVLPNGKTAQEILDENIDLTLRDAQDDLNKYKLFPMIKLGFM
jgi:hypothetical protein